MIDTIDQHDTFADLLERLGGIPLDRIVAHPTPGTATEDDVIRFLEKPRKRICELIDGVLVEKAVGFREGVFGSWIGHMIWKFIDAEDMGLVLGSDSPFRLQVGLVRFPDICFISWDRMPGGEMPDVAIGSIVPNLAIEVLSRSNTKAEIELKLDHYFEAGVQAAWVINPKTQTADVYTSRRRVKHFDSTGVIDGGKVLPGFQLSLAELFAVPKRKKRSKK